MPPDPARDDAHGTPEATTPVTPDELSSALLELERLIRDSDPVGVDAHIDIVNRYPNGRGLRHRLERLQRQIDDFDFDAAGDTLAIITDQLPDCALGNSYGESPVGGALI